MLHIFRFMMVAVCAMFIGTAYAATLKTTTAPVPYNATSPGAINKVQIPTTQYVRDYLSTAGKLPDLKLENVGAFQIPTEKYIFSAIDHVNAENGNETHYADNASAGIPMDLSYFLEQTEQKLETCPVPWDGTPERTAYTKMSYVWNSLAVPFAPGNWDDVVYGNGTFVAYGYSDDISNGIAYSNDNGVSWNRAYLRGRHLMQLIYGNGMFVGSGYDEGDYESITFSPDGINWGYYSVDPDVQIGNVLYAEWDDENGNKIKRFVTLGVEYNYNNGVTGATYYALYSDDGTNWTEHEIDTVERQNGVSAFNLVFINGHFFAKNNGDILISPDGINWDILDTKISFNNQIIYNDDIWLGYNGSRLYYSTDYGATWNSINLINDHVSMIEGLAYGELDGDDGNKFKRFVAIVQKVFFGSETDSGLYAMYSDDGINWITANGPLSIHGMHGLKYDDGKFIINYSDKIFISDDGGQTWHESQTDEFKYTISDHNCNGNICIIGTGSQVLITHNYGNTWKATNMFNVGNEHLDIHDVMYADGRFVAVADAIAAYSDNGTDWKPVSFSYCYSGEIGYDNGIFFANYDVGEDTYRNKFAVSRDRGVTWQEQNIGSLYTAAYVNDVLFKNPLRDYYRPDVPQASFDDGQTWYTTNLDRDTKVEKIKYINNRYYVVDYGMVYSSIDGITWSQVPMSSNYYWHDIAGNSNIMVITGTDAIIYSTDKGANWNFVNMMDGIRMGIYEGAQVSDLQYSDGMFYNDAYIRICSADDFSSSRCQYQYYHYISNDGITWRAIGRGDVWSDSMAYGKNTFIYGDYSVFILGKYSVSSNTNPWAVGESCSVADGAIACDAPLVGGVATCKNAKCSCTRQKLIKNGEYVDNVAQTPVVINRKFADQNACNLQCADVCADNAVNNTDGAQKDILCGK